MTTAATKQAREPLSRERVLRAAMALADEQGIEALSMRRLAAELGVEAMSLYYYVRSKAELLDGILGLAQDEIEVPSGRGGWKAAVRRSAISYHDTLMRHPWMLTVEGSGTGGGSPAVFLYMDSLLRTLREAGLSPVLSHHAYHALESHIVGSALWLARIPPKEQLDGLARQVLAELPVEQFPDVATHIEQHLTGEARGMKFFEFGLDLLLDGFERAREP